MSAPPGIHPFEAAVLAALFAAAITLPLVKQMTVGEPDTSAFEKRELARMPSFAGSWKRLVKYLPGKLDDYYSDHFGFRNLLLKAGYYVNFKWLKNSQRVVIGKQGWLFYKMDPPLFTQSLSEADLAKWKSYLEHRQQWLAAKGIKYLFVVPPDKDSIYPEFLPLTSRRPPEELPVDQLVRYLKETHSSVDILSLRETLLAAKTQEPEPLYYKQDTHWNSLGAFYGYEAIIHHLAKWFPDIKAKPRADYRVTFATDETRDIALLAGLPDSTALKGPVLQPLTPESAQKQTLPPANLPRAAMMRDSFSYALAPYLSESFSSITYFGAIHSREYEKTMADAILKDKTDIFIEECLQRSLTVVPDDKIIFRDVEKTGPDKENP